MIDKKQLRLGSWVSYEGRYYPIGALSNDYPYLDTIKFGYGVVEYENLEPILITPDILEKAGFEYIEIGDEVYEQTWSINHQQIIWGPCDKGSFYHDFLTGGEIKYLHQLQNFVSALTGTELEINL